MKINDRIQVTQNIMELNNRKIKNHPPSLININTLSLQYYQ